MLELLLELRMKISALLLMPCPKNNHIWLLLYSFFNGIMPSSGKHWKELLITIHHPNHPHLFSASSTAFFFPPDYQLLIQMSIPDRCFHKKNPISICSQMRQLHKWLYKYRLWKHKRLNEILLLSVHWFIQWVFLAGEDFICFILTKIKE